VSEGTVTRARLPPEGTVSRSKVSEGTVARARLPPSLVRGHASEQPPSAEPDRSSYIPMPPPTSPEMKAAVSQRRLFTEERNLMADTQRRHRMMGVAAGIALVGVVCFAFGVWKFSQKPPPDTDPNVSAVSGAVEQYLNQPPEPAPKPRSRPTAPPEPQPEPEGVSSSDEAGDSTQAGVAYLSIDANRPARAYIDGVRVKRNLPLVRYPVKPGTREIIVETLGVPYQREVFPVRLERGEHKKLEQLFPDTPHR
jgi:serine/threonine-protein kinase